MEENEVRKINDIEKKIADLELVLAQKQFDIDFLKKMIELAEQEYKIDIRNLNPHKSNDTESKDTV